MLARMPAPLHAALRRLEALPARLPRPELLALLERIAAVASTRIDAGSIAHGALEAALGPVAADGGAVYLVAGDEIVLCAGMGGEAGPVSEIRRLPIAGSPLVRLLEGGGPRQW